MHTVKNSLEYIPSWETKSSSADQEIIHALRRPNFHYRIHKNTQLAPLLTRVNIVCNLQFFFLKARFNTIPRLGPSLRNELFSSGCPTNTP